MSDIKPWKLLGTRLAYNGRYRKVETRTYELPSGTTRYFDIIAEGPAVSVFALTPEQKVILIEQYRPGPGKVLLELPGGGIDPGRSPLQTAEHELAEETGYTGQLTEIRYSSRSAWSSQWKYTYVATGCQRTLEQNLGPNEFLNVITLTLDEYRKALRSGDIADIDSGYLALDYLNLL